MKVSRQVGVGVSAVFGLIAGLASIVGPASAQDGSIRLLSGYAQGSLTDQAARLAGKALGDTGAPARIETMPGKAGRVAAEAVAGAAPDGRTLLVTEILNMALIEREAPALKTALVPVAKLTDGFSTALFVDAASPIRTWADFVAASRAGTLKAASTTRLSVFSMPLGLIEKHWRVRFEEVDSDGAWGLANLVKTGKADFTIMNTGLLTYSAGTLRPILTFGAERSKAFPDVPTLAEVTTNRKLAFTLSYGVMAPRGTPAATIKALAEKLQTLNADSKARADSQTSGLPLNVSGPQTLAMAHARGQRVANTLLGPAKP